MHRLSALVLVAGLTLAGVGAAFNWKQYDETEQRLLDQRASEAGALLQSAVNVVITPLSTAAVLAATTDGDPSAFGAVLARSLAVGQFSSAVLLEAGSTEPLAAVGEPAHLFDAGTARVTAMLEQATATGGLTVIDTLDLPGRRLGLGYAFTSPDAELASVTYVVYAESAVPAEPAPSPGPGEPFEGLEFAAYLGRGERSDDLLLSTVDDLPMEGRRGVAETDFGDSHLTLVVTSDVALSGQFARVLPWLLAIGGVLCAIASALLVEHLLRRRAHAERLATDIARLYDEQRRRSELLQRSLLPSTLPSPPGVSVVERYWPAEEDAEVGGDFYDLFALDGGRWAIAIGDVCGRGIEAAALTGVTRHTIRAAARYLDDPAAVLRAAHEAVHSFGGDTFTTACFAFLTIDGAVDGTVDGTVEASPGASLDLALGGHPRPLRCRADGTVEPLGVTGMVLGVVEPHLSTSHHELAQGDMLVFYTDGITDSPGDRAVTVEELTTIIARNHADPDRLADEIHASLVARRPGGAGDDVALLVLRWEPQADARRTNVESVAQHKSPVTCAVTEDGGMYCDGDEDVIRSPV